MARRGIDRWRRPEMPGWAGDLDAGVLAPSPLVSSRQLLGTRVVNRRGQPVGRLDDLICDAGTGSIAYAVVSARSKRFAVPWGALEHDPGAAGLVWNVDPEVLRRSPGLRGDGVSDDEPETWPGEQDEGLEAL